jgi:uncharacterized DUF497 family protein
VQFEWDDDKAASNLARHGVSFEEARTVFGDRLASTVRDDEHSGDEERELTVGVSAAGRTIVVWHTDRGNRIRIIGARAATPAERRAYESE